MLKLVVNNTRPLCEKTPQGNGAKVSFLTSPLQNPHPLNFRRLSENLYAFSHHDLDHRLGCTMNVDLRESYAYTEEGATEEERELSAKVGDGMK